MRVFFVTLERIDLVFKKLLPWFFLISVFLLHIPYYYLLPIQLVFLNSYFLSRLVTLFIFLYLMLSPSFYRNKTELRNDKTAIILSLLLIGQSLSIFAAFSVSSFLNTFEDLIFATMFYINTVFFLKLVDKKFIKYLFLIIIFSTLISVIDEIVLFIHPDFYLKFADQFLYPSQIEFIQASLFRNRLFVNKYNEIVIPFLIYSLFILNKDKRIYKQLLILIFIFTIGIIALFSGWRIRLLVFSVAFFGSLFIMQKIIKRLFLIGIIFIMCLIFFVGNLYMKYNLKYSTLSRLFFENPEDVKALTVRFSFYQKALELFLSSPLIGVGQGHYKLIGNRPYKNYISLSKEQKTEAELLSIGPHNIFLGYLAETGIIGTVPFVIFIFFALNKDFHLFKNRANQNYLKQIISLSFWLLFLFSLLHTEVGFHFFAILFGFRALIQYI